MQANSSASGRSSTRRRKQLIGLSQHQELQLKDRLRPQVPSEPWLEAQFKWADDEDQDGSRIIYRYHDPHVFPPGGEATAMVRCPACGIFMPPNAFEHGRCLDHARHEGWGPSPSAETIRALQLLNLRMKEVELLPESARALRAEIERFETRQKRRAKSGTARKKRKSSNDKASRGLM